MAGYEEALEYIHGLYRFGSRLGLTRPRRLLAALGDPHLGLRVIHVAGTNGKGSVATMTASVLRAAGYRTGLYISPYLSDFGERIVVDGEPIAPEETAELVFGEVKPAAERLAATGDPEDQVTEFEFVTALGFLYFARRAVDFLVCEVGLGGRFDATNVVERPLLSAITAIGLDHTDRLGATVAAIAAEKAGIIKRSAPVVSSPQPAEALDVLVATARRRDCPFYLAGSTGAEPEAAEPASAESGPGGRDGPGPGRLSPGGRVPDGRVTFRGATLRGQTIDFSGPGFAWERDLLLPLLGPHQLDNAATALTAVGVLKERGQAPAVDARALREGLAKTVWPGRFEVFGDSPPVIVDGAHNPPGAAALVASLRQLLPQRRVFLVLGILGDKDVDGYLDLMLPPQLPEVAGVFACQPANPRAMPATELAHRITGHLARHPGPRPDLPVTVVPGVGDALRRALAAAGPADAVCVAGSLYQVGEARAAAAKAKGAAAGTKDAPATAQMLPRRER